MYACKQITGNCKKCGRCCTFDRARKLSTKQEKTIKQAIYQKTGFIYPHPFNRFGLTVQNYELEKCLELAKKLKIKIRLLPKKVSFDAKTKQAIVFDWFIDADKCPFLEMSTSFGVSRFGIATIHNPVGISDGMSFML